MIYLAQGICPSKQDTQQAQVAALERRRASLQAEQASSIDLIMPPSLESRVKFNGILGVGATCFNVAIAPYTYGTSLIMLPMCTPMAMGSLQRWCRSRRARQLPHLIGETERKLRAAQTALRQSDAEQVPPPTPA